MTVIKTMVFTGLALIAFAANSILCRYALEHNAIDAGSFTSLRLLSGAIMLILIISLQHQSKHSHTKGSWIAGFMLFAYACAFSFAYLELGAAMGALILFGAVQVTMILHAVFSGDRLHISEWFGLCLAFFGFVYLILPGITAPPLADFTLMAFAGIAWAGYTLKGRQSSQALMDTAYNFIKSLPFVALLIILTYQNAMYSTQGVLLAIMSGAVTSALGYAIWYRALRGLSTTQAAVVQVFVPVITAVISLIVLSEAITLRLTVASALILGGILLVILGRYYFVNLRLK